MREKTIYFAGGCFWGVQEYFSRIPGVNRTVSGYANGTVENPTYRQVCTGTTGHAETVKIDYDGAVTGIERLVESFFAVIDPTVKNRQGNDIGTQYRTGVFYTDESDRAVLDAAFKLEQEKYDKPLVTELLPLRCFYPAEEYHQDYLKKNPGGYCHINLDGTAQTPRGV